MARAQAIALHLVASGAPRLMTGHMLDALTHQHRDTYRDDHAVLRQLEDKEWQSYTSNPNRQRRIGDGVRTYLPDRFCRFRG